jgi:hypothetical protein
MDTPGNENSIPFLSEWMIALGVKPKTPNKKKKRNKKKEKKERRHYLHCARDWFSM